MVGGLAGDKSLHELVRWWDHVKAVGIYSVGCQACDPEVYDSKSFPKGSFNHYVISIKTTYNGLSI